MYALVAMNNSELDIDPKDLEGAHEMSSVQYMVKLNDSAQVRSTWTIQTEDDWNKAIAGVSDDLSLAKYQKIAELQSASDAAVSAFQSPALGTPHTYLADEKSMAYLNAQYVFVNGDHYDGLPSKWYTVEEGFIDHTKDQITQVFLDGRAYINEQKTVKLASLLEQVQAATTVDEVSGIIW